MPIRVEGPEAAEVVPRLYYGVVPPAGGALAVAVLCARAALARRTRPRREPNPRA